NYCLIFCGSDVILYCVFFFFSSRSRHTRSKRDWSSDVCSSDLTLLNLIPRIFKATSGEILIDGREVNEWPLKDLRDTIGLVPQQIGRASCRGGVLTTNGG